MPNIVLLMLKKNLASQLYSLSEAKAYKGVMQ